MSYASPVTGYGSETPCRNRPGLRKHPAVTGDACSAATHVNPALEH